MYHDYGHYLDGWWTVMKVECFSKLKKMVGREHFFIFLYFCDGNFVSLLLCELILLYSQNSLLRCSPVPYVRAYRAAQFSSAVADVSALENGQTAGPRKKSNHAICSGAKEKGCSLVLYVVAKGEKEGRDAHLTMGLENNSINCFVTFKFFSPFGLPKHVPPSLNKNPGLAPPLNRATF